MKCVKEQVNDQVIDGVYDQVFWGQNQKLWVQIRENIEDHLWERVRMEVRFQVENEMLLE